MHVAAQTQDKLFTQDKKIAGPQKVHGQGYTTLRFALQLTWMYNVDYEPYSTASATTVDCGRIVASIFMYNIMDMESGCE